MTRPSTPGRSWGNILNSVLCVRQPVTADRVHLWIAAVGAAMAAVAPRAVRARVGLDAGWPN